MFRYYYYLMCALYVYCYMFSCFLFFFFFKQKTAYEMRISDWSSDVCSSDLLLVGAPAAMDMMLTGRALSANAARLIGLVDKVTEPALLLDAAIELAKRDRKSVV